VTALREHYEAVREEFDYARPAIDVGSMSASLLDRAFAATTDADALREADDDTLFVASAGLSGTPHVGTVAQMYAVERFHEAGFDTQFLLADYEKYAADGRDLDAVRGLADATGSTDFGSRTAELLCLADFLHPTIAGGYDRTVFVLGVDEHALVLANEQYAAKTPFEPAFEGLFTRLVPGLDGYPKMAKTIPGSGITMDMAPERVRRLVREADDSRAPAESTVYQMLCLASEHDGRRLDDLADACRRGGEAWDAAVEAYADFLAGLADAWSA